MNEDFYWSTVIQAIAFGSKENAFGVYDDSTNEILAVLDSGSPHIVVPERQYKAFMR